MVFIGGAEETRQKEMQTTMKDGQRHVDRKHTLEFVSPHAIFLSVAHIHQRPTTHVHGDVSEVIFALTKCCHTVAHTLVELGTSRSGLCTL